MKKAVVTGGSSGIGKAFAELLKTKNYDVLTLGSCDALLPEQTELVIDHIWKKKADLVVNAAGFGLYGNAAEISLDRQMEMVSVNCQALMEITLESVKLLLKEGRCGTILNVSSLASHFPAPGMAVYGATKAFVTSFSQAVDFEVQKRGVRVLVSCPGMVETRFASRAAGKRVKVKGQMSPAYVAHRMWQQVRRGKRVDTFPKFHFLPAIFAMPMIYRSIQKRL